MHAPDSLNCPLSPLSDNAPIALIHPYVPHQTLVIHGDKAISHADFLRDLDVLVKRLPEGGFALNLCEDRYYFLLGFCALLIKGAINLLPPNRQPSTLFELAQDYPGCYCLQDKPLGADLPGFDLSVALAGTPATEEAQLQIPLIQARQVAAIAFTSGSTGKPKPNPKCWGTLCATARLLGARLSADLTTPIIVGTVPPQHMYGLETTLFMSLQAGCIMHSDKPFYPADVQQLLAQLPAPVILVTTPIHLRAIISAELPMPGLARIISATAPLDLSLAQNAEACFNSTLWEIYGCTEAGSMATRRSTQTVEWQLLQDFTLSLDEIGAVARAPHLAGDAPIQDQLQLLSEDKFLLAGRNADMINLAGKRASLANLSLQLLRVAGVDDGVIFLPPDATHAEVRPVGLVVSQRTEKEILAELAQWVDPTLLPRPLRRVPRLPRNETGKLTAATLHQLWSQTHEPR